MIHSNKRTGQPITVNGRYSTFANTSNDSISGSSGEESGRDEEFSPLIEPRDDPDVTVLYEETNSKATHSVNRVIKSYLFAVIAFMSIVGSIILFSSKENTDYFYSFFDWSTDSTTTTTVSTTTKTVVTTKDGKPNIIMIVIDDLGYGSIGYNKFDLDYVTPKMTALIEDGVMLTNYYTAEVCTPSRAALMTGRYPIRLGVQLDVVGCNNRVALDLDETLLPEVLRDYGGYTNYGIGKWHLGHYTPEHLPTARGFDHFLGYMDGGETYWTKIDPDSSNKQYYDFIQMNNSCYREYNANDYDDFTTYSTFMFSSRVKSIVKTHFSEDGPTAVVKSTTTTESGKKVTKSSRKETEKNTDEKKEMKDKKHHKNENKNKHEKKEEKRTAKIEEKRAAIKEVEKKHNADHTKREMKQVDIEETIEIEVSPMFLYFAFQAVHTPFIGDLLHPNGLPQSYFEEDEYNQIVDGLVGKERRQLALALKLADDGIGHLITALESTGQLENSYIILTSDNGGCVSAGGRSGNLRGNKGTFYEGKYPFHYLSLYLSR